MMKVLTEEWYAAETENFDIRNEAREAFWAAVGVQRDSDLAAVDIHSLERLPNALALLSKAGGALGDAELERINAIGSAALTKYGLWSRELATASRSISLGSNSPSDYKAGFFLTDVLPIFDLAT